MVVVVHRGGGVMVRDATHLLAVAVRAAHGGVFLLAVAALEHRAPPPLLHDRVRQEPLHPLLVLALLVQPCKINTLEIQ